MSFPPTGGLLIFLTRQTVRRSRQEACIKKSPALRRDRSYRPDLDTGINNVPRPVFLRAGHWSPRCSQDLIPRFPLLRVIGLPFTDQSFRRTSEVTNLTLCL